eukprot:PITA_35184
MKNDILTFVVECDVCQFHKGETIKAPGTLQPLPIPTSIWTKVSMDFITGLPKSGNKSVIMVVVDRLSKYAHFCTLPHPFTPTLVAQPFMDQIFKLHGMPTSIVSDRDPIFTSNFWQELFRLQGTHKQMVKLKPSTNVWKPTLGVSLQKSNIFGFSGYLWLNGEFKPVYLKLDEEGSIWLQPEQVLDTRERPLRGRVIKEVLVKWKDTSSEDATWEPTTILQQFLQLQP